MTEPSSTAIDCSRNGPDQYSDECLERGDAFLGMVFVGGMVLAIVFVVLWWWLERRRTL